MRKSEYIELLNDGICSSITDRWLRRTVEEDPIVVDCIFCDIHDMLNDAMGEGDKFETPCPFCPLHDAEDMDDCSSLYYKYLDSRGTDKYKYAKKMIKKILFIDVEKWSRKLVKDGVLDKD